MRHTSTRRTASGHQHPSHERINAAVADILEQRVADRGGAVGGGEAARRGTTRRVHALITLLGRGAPDPRLDYGPGISQERTAALQGALALAGALDDARLARALREAVLTHLMPDGA
ncbi:hypothetical protein H3H37_23675 [Duganella sp. LX20W]|uniref:Uncharacterized protein n=1 Tax=Rugamonas brunnea TaxID=2758569 RepID=A0A7W2EWV7_9BURK|nr:hypothetical protein [Rugamonas brunnea]MBA5640066.1 hypothetical protein [Rugamonas brunnea]